MEWKDALPLLQENHLAVVTTIMPNGRPQSTVVSVGVMDDKLVFASPTHTVKVKNIQRTGRASITVIKFDTRRYVTVEGPASIVPWQDTPAHIKGLKDLYAVSGRRPTGTDEEFAQQMRNEQRGLVSITPERLYGSLRRGSPVRSESNNC
jgi:PPOX class probable F420-dependent enzyme